MAKVDIGKLRKMFRKEPELAATVAYASKAILINTESFGEYATFMVFGQEESTPEIIISKAELLRFANEVQAKLEVKK